MFTIDEMLSKNNQRLAFEHFATKNDGCGPDGMHVSELEKYWRMNHDQIISDLKNQEYQPGIILIREHIRLESAEYSQFERNRSIYYTGLLPRTEPII